MLYIPQCIRSDIGVSRQKSVSQHFVVIGGRGIMRGEIALVRFIGIAAIDMHGAYHHP